MNLTIAKGLSALRSISLLLCLTAAVPVPGAERTPKAIESGQADRVTVVDADSITLITPESLPAYETSQDGISFTVLRIRKGGAEAVRVGLEDIRLGADQALLVYGSDSERVWIYKGGLDTAAIVRGDTATIEIQCALECPSDLPFRVSEVEAVSIPEELDRTDPDSDEQRTGHFRGVDVDYVVRGGLALFEGDMVLGPAEEIEPARGVTKGSRDAVAITGQQYRWTKGRIPYVISSTVSNQSRILSAISHWNSKLAGTINLVPRTTESVYVQFIRSGSCQSSVGMYPNSNYVYVSDGCSTGSLIHEIGHIVGLSHEHSREDRNKHVKILWTNILASALGNFGLQVVYGTDIGAYDFNSIMHYPAHAFTANGMPTIETIPAGIPIGQRLGLSTGDIAAVRSMYGTAYAATVVEPAPAPVATVSVTVAANPTTETIVIDGRSYTGSATVQWAAGSSHTIGATNRFADGTSSSFVRWNDGGAQSHSIVASSSTTLYKADFSLAYRVTASANPVAAGSVIVTPPSGNGYYAANSSLILDASAASGYCFTGWTGFISGTPNRASMSVTKPYAVTANFQPGGFSLSSSSKYTGSAGGVFPVGVSGNSGCFWTAVSKATWITLRAPYGGIGSGVLIYIVAPNDTSSARVGSMVIAGRSYIVNQAGSY